MKRFSLPACVLAVAGLAAGHTAFAQPMPPQPETGEHGPMDMQRGFGMPGHAAPGMRERGGPGMHGHGLAFLHGIQLSEAQQDRVFAIMHAQAPARRELEKKIRAAHDALRLAGQSAQFDEGRASAHAQALGQAIAAEALLRARTAAQVYAVLTPEQREQAGKARGPRPGRP